MRVRAELVLKSRFSNFSTRTQSIEPFISQFLEENYRCVYFRLMYSFINHQRLLSTFYGPSSWLKAGGFKGGEGLLPASEGEGLGDQGERQDRS